MFFFSREMHPRLPTADGPMGSGHSCSRGKLLVKCHVIALEERPNVREAIWGQKSPEEHHFP